MLMIQLLTAPGAPWFLTRIQEQGDDFSSSTTESKSCTSISFDSVGHVPTGECRVPICVPSVRVLLWFRDKEHGMEVTAFELATLRFCDFNSGLLDIYKERVNPCQIYILPSHLVISAAVILRK